MTTAQQDTIETLTMSLIGEQLLERHDLTIKDGIINNVNVGLDIVEEFTRSPYRYGRSTSNGKLRVEVGTYSTKVTRFRQKKDGTFNYDKIADKIAEKYELRIALIKQTDETEVKHKELDAIITEVQEKHDIYLYGRTLTKRTSRDGSEVYGLTLSLNVESVEQISALLDLATELGIDTSH